MTNGSPSQDGLSPALVSAAGWAWRVLVLAGFVALSAVIAYRLRIVTVPMFAALLISTLLVPLRQRLERHGVKHGLATLAVLLGTGLVTAGVVIGLASPVAHQFRDLGPQVAVGVEDVKNWLAKEPFNISQADLDKYVDSLSNQVRSSAGTLRAGVISSATLVGEVVVGALLTIVLTVFFTKDHDLIANALVNRLPRHHREIGRAAGHRAFSTLSAYLRGVAATGLVDAILIGIVLAILGTPLLLPLVVLTFFGAFFPVVGATAAGVVCALVALVSGGPTDAIIVLIAVVIVQQVEGHLLQPLLVGRAVQLHPVVIIIALTSGGIIAGMLGAFCAVPIVAMASSAIREIEARRPEIMA